VVAGSSPACSTRGACLRQSVDITIGQAQVEGEAVSTQAISYHVLKDIYKYNSIQFKAGLGVRWTRLNSSEFAIYKNEEIVDDLSLNAYNIAFFSEAHYNNWVVGFNIDLLGQTSGDNSNINGTNQDPSSFNMLRGGENDEGTLNSEFWFGRRLDNLTIRGGMAHIVTQYEGDNPKNEKRQRFFDAFFLSAGWSF
jgi:hypothetical protein